ncbi:MAG: hypothetical protein M1836_002979 [Candelina mexicana]|nr:MAG: hypothetical protein M1836_002979 [Candelina mexicana]
MDPKPAPPQNYIPPGGFINMDQAICVPFPDIPTGPQPVLTREERLRTIISNLENHHEQVRYTLLPHSPCPPNLPFNPHRWLTNQLPPQNSNNILTQGLAAKEWIRTRDTSNDPPVSPKLLHQLNRSMIASLKTTHDPNLPPPIFNPAEHHKASLKATNSPARPIGSNPAMTITGQLFMALMEELDQKRAEYDERARKTIEFYQKALDRGLGESGAKVDSKVVEGIPSLEKGDGGLRKSVSFAADTTSRDGKGQASGGQRPGTIAKNGGYDASRDPRLR